MEANGEKGEREGTDSKRAIDRKRRGYGAGRHALVTLPDRVVLAFWAGVSGTVSYFLFFTDAAKKKEKNEDKK